MGAKREDEEITDLLTKLYTIQEDIGAKPKTSDNDKREKAENVAKMGTNKKSGKEGIEIFGVKIDNRRSVKVDTQIVKGYKGVGRSRLRRR
mmetsp:Transcript_41478/g.47289  ORF Transcript_41478/g.47289 Transcript_41478/m.47289 type:complete len:91 (-) Transcript_41478:770-1042(-)